MYTGTSARSLGLFGGLLDALVHALEDLVQATGEVAVLVDVPDELVREVHLARIEIEQVDLIAQMIGEIARVDRHRLVVLALLVLLAPPARVEAVEQDLLPIDLALLVLLRLGLGIRRLFLDFALVLLVVLRLDHVEEGIVEELLLEMLLEVEERHVEQIHRLIQARIDLELLLELGVLGEPLPHAPFPMLSTAKRERSRAESVGPR